MIDTLARQTLSVQVVPDLLSTFGRVDIVHVTTLLVAVTLLLGCASTATVRDRSTGDETASIEGLRGVFIDCRIYGPLPVDFDAADPGDAARAMVDALFADHFDSPYVAATSLVVDAGPIRIEASCTEKDAFGGSFNAKVRFDFLAEKDHKYALILDGTDDCLTLLDNTTASQVLACEPLDWGEAT